MLELEICLKGSQTDLAPWCKAKNKAISWESLPHCVTLHAQWYDTGVPSGQVFEGLCGTLSHPLHPLDFIVPHLKDEGDNLHQTKHLGSRESHPWGCPWIPSMTTTPWQKPVLRARTPVIAACIRQELATCWACMGFPTVHPHRYLEGS